ncbi:MAG: sugar phosphate nucleotidyltransferase [Patescibacteria group bacterium]
MKIVIRAGGGGTRLWPLSRIKKPKQFLPLLGKKSLLQSKYDEILPLLKSHKDLYISVPLGFIPIVKRQLPKVYKENIIVEPISRNTGPAIGLESIIIQSRTKPDEDPVIASLTVDDVFGEVGKFRTLLKASEQFLKKKPFYALAIASSIRKPDLGLSYIELGKHIGKERGQEFNLAKRWIEKPKKVMLKRIMKNSKFNAHTGQYIWRNSTILSYFEMYQPFIYARLQKIAGSIGTSRYPSTLKREYSALPKMSIEEAVARFIPRMGVAAGRLGWTDTGKWYLIHDLLPHDAQKNVTKGKTLMHHTKRTLVFASKDRLISTLGLRDMVVVDTGDAILIAHQSYSSEVKEIVEMLKKKKMNRYL